VRSSATPSATARSLPAASTWIAESPSALSVDLAGEESLDDVERFRAQHLFLVGTIDPLRSHESELDGARSERSVSLEEFGKAGRACAAQPLHRALAGLVMFGHARAFGHARET
jgi:hypothetical protein